MARQTFGQALDAANELDAKYGGNLHGDEVLCRMLGHVGARWGTLGHVGAQAQAKAAPVRLLVKSLAAKPQPAVRHWSRSEVESALNDGVVRGRISGTAATAAMNAFDRKR